MNCKKCEEDIPCVSCIHRNEWEASKQQDYKEW